MNEWKNVNNKLVKDFEFTDFNEAINFINKIAKIANKHNHHPEIKNIYNKVFLSLSTHEEGNVVTEKDNNLAKEIDNII